MEKSEKIQLDIALNKFIKVLAKLVKQERDNFELEPVAINMMKRIIKNEQKRIRI